MIRAVPDILARIVERKRQELSEKTVRPEELEAAAARIVRRDFRNALVCRSPAIIAEFKKASPSKGNFAPDADPAATATAYERGGAAALSVLTDRDFFHGGFADMAAARAAVTLPVLRKDFTVTEYDVQEAAANGADAILLIAAILTEVEMRRLRELAQRYEMAALVEVHDEEELEPALGSGAEIIGVNNRDLRTFEVTLETSLRLSKRIPAGVVKVAESGIRSSRDLQTLQGAGFQAFLVGEHLMKAPDPAEALRELTGC